MSNNITVKITADVVDLRSKMALAKADLAATNKELGTLAKTASGGGMTTGLQSDLTKAAEKSVVAETRVKGLASEIKKLEGTAGHGHGHTGALRYIREIFDEVSSGRTRYLPSTLATLAQQYGGLSAAALGAAVAVGAVVAGLGYLEYRALEAEQEVDDLSTAFRLTGRSSEIGADGVSYMLSFLDSVPNASSAATQAFVQFAATAGNVNLVLANQVGQLLPAFEKAFGKKGPEAASKLLASLSDLSVNGFRKLDQELLNLSPTEYEQIEHLISIGDQAKATSEIIAILAHRTGTYVKSLGDQIYDVEQKMSSVIKNAAFREGIKLNFDPKSLQSIENVKRVLASQGGLVSQSAIDELNKLEGELRSIRAEEAKNGKNQADHAYKLQVQAAEKLSASLDKQGEIKKKLLKLDHDLAEAEVRKDRHGIAVFSKSIAYEKAELEKLQKAASHHGHHTTHGHLAGRSSAEMEARRQIMAIERAGQQITSMLRGDASADEQISNQQLQQKKQVLQQEVESGRITNVQMIDAEIALTQKMYEQDLARLRDEMNANKGRLADENSIVNQIREAEVRLDAELAALRAKRAQAREKDTQKEVQTWERAHRGLFATERTLIEASLGTWRGFEQTVESLALRNFENLVAGEARMWTERLLLKQTATDESKAIGLKGTLAEISQSAAAAGAAAAKAVAGIPVIGPALAPAAMVATEALVFGAEALISAAGGQWQVPYDGQLTQLHKDEMVMPAYLANPMRQVVTNIASGGSSAAARGPMGAASGPDVHFHIHANDARSVQAWLNENGEHIARSLQRVWKDRPGLAPAGRSA